MSKEKVPKPSVRKLQRSRLIFDLKDGERDRINSIKLETESSSSVEVIRNALKMYDIVLEEVQRGGDLMIRNRNNELVQLMVLDSKSHVSPIYYSISKNKSELSQHSLAVVQSLREMQSVFSLMGHNNPPSPIEDEAMAQISTLEAELSALKASLDKDDIEKAAENVINLSKHVNTFLDNFMPLAGKGMAVLVVVSTATLLSKAGIESGIVSSLLEKALK